MPTRNVNEGSRLGVGAGAGVAAGAGTGITVSGFLTRRPDCAEIASVQITTSAIARLTLRLFENCRRRIDFFFQSSARYVHLHSSENFVGHGPSRLNNFTVAIDAGSS